MYNLVEFKTVSEITVRSRKIGHGMIQPHPLHATGGEDLLVPMIPMVPRELESEGNTRHQAKVGLKLP